YFDFEPSSLASPVEELLKVGHRHRRAAFGDEHERRPAFDLSVEATQRPQLPACQGVSRRRAVLCTGDRQRCGREVNLRPLQVAALGSLDLIRKVSKGLFRLVQKLTS